MLVRGLITGNVPLEISGAFIFLLPYLFDLPVEYKEAKLFRAGKWKPNEASDILETLALRFGQAIFILGLLLTFIKHTSGMIIFGGAMIFYLISGWITRDVAGIPLEMRYGVWQKRNFRRRH